MMLNEVDPGVKVKLFVSRYPLCDCEFDKLYSPQMVVTRILTYKILHRLTDNMLIFA